MSVQIKHWQHLNHSNTAQRAISTKIRLRAVVFFLSLFTAVFGQAVSAATPAVNTLKPGLFGGRGDVAIQGYDPVAYFDAGKPTLGQDAFVYEWHGAKWKFASAEHLAAFKAQPEHFAPQYGGYCAYGVAKGNLVSIEPDKWTVREGKLYLNYDADVQEKWLKDPAGYIHQADSSFSDLLK